VPQTRETGLQGHLNGYRNADSLAKRLGATRISQSSNEFRLSGKAVLLKTGDRGAVVSAQSLDRVDAVIYGYRDRDDWAVFELKPSAFREHGAPSRSKSHVGRDFLQLSKGQCRALGRRVDDQ
jgi:hypothetical protein